MKRRDFGKAFAAALALLTGDSKGIYDREGQKKVTRGLVEKPSQFVSGVDFIQK